MNLVLSAGLFGSLGFSFILMPFLWYRATTKYGVSLIIYYVVFLIICLYLQFSGLNNSCR